MFLVVGLGNPGRDYSGNRHNIGFMAVDEIVRRYSFDSYKSKFKGEISNGTINGEKILILKPTTYMNNSGVSVSAAASFYKIPPEKVIVIHDEIDLVSGKLRIKKGGGTAGHNGLRSIASHFSKDFMRVRIGVGHPGSKDRVAGYVLRDFAKTDMEWLELLLDSIADSFPFIIKEDYPAFMSKIAELTRPVKPKKSDLKKIEKPIIKEQKKEESQMMGALKKALRLGDKDSKDKKDGI